MIFQILSSTENPVSYKHVRAHETKANIVCLRLLDKKNVVSKFALKQDMRLGNAGGYATRCDRIVDTLPWVPLALAIHPH